MTSPPKVSVVVPVYNPGPMIELCIASVLGQTLAQEEFEAIFVDDGSTDGTAARLDELAASRPNVSVVHIPPSGAPGRPRNVGLDRARGEYVQFLDADDELAPAALERLYAMALRNRSDIVVGKFASASVARRQDLFRRSRAASTLADIPALVESSFGPTKLFRLALLREHEIRFPEGWRQMEDQYFTVRAYLAAGVISVLADEPIYFFNRREAGGNISLELLDPDLHVAHLGEILDLVIARTPPGDLRTRLLRKFYRMEILARLSGPQFLASDPAYQARFFKAVRELTLQRFDEALDPGLTALMRVRSNLLRHDRLDAFLDVVRRSELLEMHAQVLKAQWRTGVLVLVFRARLVAHDGRPFSVAENGGRWIFDPAITAGHVEAVDVTGEINAIRAQGSVRDERTVLDWHIRTLASVELAEQESSTDVARLAVPTLVGTMEVDPQHVGPGRRGLSTGRWDLVVRWSGLGLQRTGALHVGPAAASTRRGTGPALLGDPPRYVVAGADDRGALTLDVDASSTALVAALAGRSAIVRRDGRVVEVLLPIVSGPGAATATATLGFTTSDGETTFPARLVPRSGHVILTTSPGGGRGLPPPGDYSVTARLNGDLGPELPLGRAVITAGGLIRFTATDRLKALDRVEQAVSWMATLASARVTSAAMATAVRLPAPVRRIVRKAYYAVRTTVARPR
jgi:poly(ribitol-phosphate) beta-N-acetylglucosaminyltransferase